MNDPLTPLQGRLAFHMERIFRSAGGRGVLAHQRFLELARKEGLPVPVDTMTDEQCVTGLRLVEEAARAEGMGLFRDIDTGWRAEVDRCRAARLRQFYALALGAPRPLRRGDSTSNSPTGRTGSVSTRVVASRFATVPYLKHATVTRGA